LLKQYQQLIKQQVLCEDKAQYSAVAALDMLSKQLVQLSNERKNSHSKRFLNSIVARLPLHKIFRYKLHPESAIPQFKSLYLYGRVGRGKTMLMDIFYQNISIKYKKRIHFHRFMESVHQQLNELSIQQSSSAQKVNINPLAYIAKSWATNIELLCFDEFFVSDIGDAMLLSGLCRELFALGITLVFTSNCKPEELYRNGLQRERFLPTIDLINQYCQILSVNGDTDHRLTDAVAVGYNNYYFTNADGEQLLAKRFEALGHDLSIILNNDIMINNRKMSYRAKTDKHIWFDFYELCSGPRSQRDYIQLSDKFETVLITHVPQFSGELVPAVFSGVEDSYQRSGVLMGSLRHLDDEARRFIALVDEFYDRKVQLIISADVDIVDLYQGQQLSFEFQRCQSRLFEMQHY
jgi:cell division protein ZapE